MGTPSGYQNRVSRNRRSINVQFCPRRQLYIDLLLEGSRILCNRVVCQYTKEREISFWVGNGILFSVIALMAAKKEIETSFAVGNVSVIL
jgi:hypothetical protein